MKTNQLFLGLALIFFSCDQWSISKSDFGDPVAKVDGRTLHTRQLDAMIAPNISELDSMAMVDPLIEHWIKDQLLLIKAEEYLGDNMPEIEMMAKDYRMQLMNHRYMEKVMKEQLDTAISTDEVSGFYEQNLDNFVLEDNIVKAKYIKVSRRISYESLMNLRKWIRSRKEDDIQALANFGQKSAIVYDDYDDKWVPFSVIQSVYPKRIYKPEVSLRYTRHNETKDSTHYFFFKIHDFVPQAQNKPIDYVQNEIKSIIINQRKRDLIKDLKNRLYNEALNHDLVKIY